MLLRCGRCVTGLFEVLAVQVPMGFDQEGACRLDSGFIMRAPTWRATGGFSITNGSVHCAQSMSSQSYQSRQIGSHRGPSMGHPHRIANGCSVFVSVLNFLLQK